MNYGELFWPSFIARKLSREIISTLFFISMCFILSRLFLWKYISLCPCKRVTVHEIYNVILWRKCYCIFLNISCKRINCENRKPKYQIKVRQCFKRYIEHYLNTMTFFSLELTRYLSLKKKNLQYIQRRSKIHDGLRILKENL